MIRRKLIGALSILYIIGGLWDIILFLHLASVTPGFINLDLTWLIGGTLALYIGFQLLKLAEFGRKFAIGLLYVRVAINLYFIVWLMSRQQEIVSSSWYFLDKEIARIANPYASEIFLTIWIVFALLTIVFLSQQETRRIFMPITPNDADAMVKSS
ncbi:MAG: hypothetical protein QM730_04030 [Anaerolineales bacterium]